MTLSELLENVNDNTVVEILNSETGALDSVYDGKDAIPRALEDCEITDIFTGMNGNTPTLCIELNMKKGE